MPFSLRVGLNQDSSDVFLRSSYADGSPQAPSVIEQSKLDRSEVLAELAGQRKATAENVRELGQLLFEILLEPDWSRWETYIDRGSSPGVLPRLRVQLEIESNQPRLWHLPWEAAFLAEHSVTGEYVFTAPERGIVRIVSSVQPTPRAPVYECLRVLIAYADPTDLYSPADLEVPPDLGRLSIVNETDAIESADNVVVQDVRAEQAKICQAIQEFKPHVLHLITHGFLDRDGKPRLVMEDPAQQALAAEPSVLNEIFRTAGLWPHLLMLPACWSLAVPGVYHSPAISLVNSSTPVAVGFLFEVDDNRAATFSRAFYPLIAGSEPVDTAVSQARYKMQGQASDDPVSWISPIVMTTGTQESYLQIVASQPAPKPTTPPPAPPQPTPPPPPARHKTIGTIAAFLGMLIVLAALAWGIVERRITADMVLVPATPSYVVGCFDNALFFEQANTAAQLAEDHLRPWIIELSKDTGGSDDDIEEAVDAVWIGMQAVALRLKELTPHTVAISAFLIDKCEVSNEEYQCLLAARTDYTAPPGWENRTCPAGQEKLPVTYISYQEAERYASWAKKRLATYGEWQYAAAAGKQQLYPWGNEPDTRKANTLFYWPRPNDAKLIAVDANELNALRLHCTAGNVSEFASGPEGMPVACGGSYTSGLLEAIVFNREQCSRTSRYDNVGFRCARDYRPRSQVITISVLVGLVGLALMVVGVWLVRRATPRDNSAG